MEEHFVTYKIAKKLIELGFNEPCLGKFSGYKELFSDEDFIDFKVRTDFQFMLLPNSKGMKLKMTDIVAPLWQQAVDWLMKNHMVLIIPKYLNGGLIFIVYDISVEGNEKRLFSRENLDEAITDVLKLI